MRRKKARRVVSRGFLIGAFLILCFVTLLTQTAFGKELVLREVLRRTQSGINGEILVGGISSPGLLRGFTFHDVAILDSTGRGFLSADSIRARLSAPALLRGDLILSGVRIWSPRVRLERLPGQDQINVTSIFLGPPVSDTSGVAPDSSISFRDSLSFPQDSLSGPGVPLQGPRRSIVLRDARIADGELDILLPLGPGANREGILTERAPDGRGYLRRYSFRDLDLDLGQATIRAPGQSGERFEVRHLSMRGEVWPNAFQLTSAEGDVRREGSRVLASFRRLEMPGSAVSGQADVQWGGGQGVRVDVEGSAFPMAMEDLFFIESRLPEGSADGPFGFRLSDAGFVLDFNGTRLASPLGGLSATGSLSLTRPMRFEALELEFDSLDLAITDPWVRDTLPLRGRATGGLALSGDLGGFELEGEVDLAAPDDSGVLTAHVTGRMGVEGGFSASSVQVTLAPMDWGALSSISPTMTLQGTGAVRMVLTGSLWGDGLGLDGELTHVPSALGLGTGQPGAAAALETGTPQGGASRVTVRGRIRRDSTSTYLDLIGDLSPLSLTALRRGFPGLPIQGEYSGSVEARGLLSDLQLRADLETSAGPLAVSSRFDARDPAVAYEVAAEAPEDFFLSRIVPGLPDPTRVQGRVAAVGRGLTLEGIQGMAEATILQGSVGSLVVDTATLRATVEEGVLHLQELTADTRAGTLEGNGTFALADGAPPGELTVSVHSPSIRAIRPFLMEEPTLIRDELTELMEGLLVSEGVNLDTLPTSAEVAVEGSLDAHMVIRGGVRGFSGEGGFDFADFRYRTDYVSGGGVQFTLQGFPGADGRVQAQVRTDSLFVRDLGFASGAADVDLGLKDGRVRLRAFRAPSDEYVARGTYVLDSLQAGRVNVDELTLRFDTVRWNLGGPASFSWGEDGYRIRDFQVVRTGGDAMRIRADGFLPLDPEAETDFTVDVRKLDLNRLARAFQIQTPLEGVVDLQTEMTGSPRQPEMTGTVSGIGLRYGDFTLGRLASEFDYEDEELHLDLMARDEGRQVLLAEGYFPVDLRLRPDGDRIPDAPVDLSVAVDSFPAAIALAFLDSMEEVEGTLSGSLRFQGRSSDLQPSGDLRLADGSAFFRPLGVRHRDVQASFQVSREGVVEVDGSLRAGGTATVMGTVTLADPLSDPRLNLSVTAQDFLAVNRRDVRQTRLSGTVLVSQSYRRPRVEGSLRVEQGVLMVEEVARSVEVVDLSDPAFFNVVDTALVTLRPVIQGSQNPFLQNLMLNVDLTMVRDSWLRGSNLNVEMAGNLGVYWDRTERTMAFLGVLDAVRGVYSVVGRQFQVQEGTVSFPGTPGVNPDLNIRAMNRLRTTDGTLEIIAAVDGSLLEPRVALSSNAAFPIAESDLVSYLIFGRPSYDLASGQRAQVANAAGVLGGAASSIAVGLFSSELGSLLAPELPIDYLAITQEYGADLGARAGLFGTPQVAIGKYLTDEIFAAVHWRPWLNGTGQSRLAALIVEAELGDNWTLEGYWEDRFFRNSIFRVVGLGADEHSLGFLLFRDWGY